MLLPVIAEVAINFVIFNETLQKITENGYVIKNNYINQAYFIDLHKITAKIGHLKKVCLLNKISAKKIMDH